MSSDRVLLISPSEGLGGGIERYVRTVTRALERNNVTVTVCALSSPSSRAAAVSTKVRFVLRVWWRCLRAREDFHLVLAHPGLLATGLVARWVPCCRSVSVICHGNDVWLGWGLRTRLLLSWIGPRVLAVSAFSAGALLRWTPAGVLAPGLDQEWFDTLRAAAKRHAGECAPPDNLHVATTFRLSEWETKGLPQVVEALQRLRPSVQVRLSIAGHGQPPAAMRRLIDPHEWIAVHSGVSDEQLAELCASADLFVLATRLRTAPPVSGEGFGLVLAEAQVAGTPVVAPARGGSWDAFWPGGTGVAPSGESVEELISTLACLVNDRELLSAMSGRCLTWAAQRFEPARYAALVYRTLMG